MKYFYALSCPLKKGNVPAVRPYAALFIISLLFSIQISSGQTISKDTILSLTHHPGDTVLVYYFTTGTFDSTNIFTAQLSDSNGSFASPVAIGSGGSPIIGIIPANTGPGVFYRIRVVSSNPVVTGQDNGSNITIISVPPPTISKDTLTRLSFQAGDTMVVYYFTTGTFGAGNTFSLELFDDSLVGSPHVVIGTGASPILGIIPTNTASGIHYRVRVVSSNPVVAGLNNGIDITIRAKRRFIGGDWALATSWFDGILPVASDNVIIDPTGGDPVTVSGNFTVSSLTLASSASMQINSGASLTVTGNLNLDALQGSIAGDGILKMSGSVAQVINTISGATLNKLVIDNMQGVSIGSTDPLQVNSNLTFLHGNLNTSSSKLVLPYNAVVTSGAGTGWVNGTMERTLPTVPPNPIVVGFEVGDNTSYAPMQAVIRNLSGTGASFLASTTGGSNPNIGSSGLVASKSVARTYNLTNNGAIFQNYDLTLNFQSDQYPGIADPSKFYISQTDDGGATWVVQRNNNYTRTDNSTKVERLASNSSFLVGVPVCDLTVNAGSDEDTYYGYPGDQSVSHTVTPSGGYPPFSYSWTLNRPLICNSINASGDELFSVTGGLCSGTGTCPTTGSTGPTPSCTSAGSNSTVNALLMDTGIVCVTVTDYVGCTASSCFTIRATDARCFAGNSGVQKVTVCHKTGNPKNPYVVLCVDPDAVPAMLAAGDYPGNCTGAKRLSASEPGEGLFSVYPNPAHNMLFVHTELDNECTCRLLLSDVTGRIILEKDIVAGPGSSQPVDLQGLSSGLYIVSVAGENDKFQCRIIIE